MQVTKPQLELDMEQCTGSKLGKEYVKAVYCHPAFLIYLYDVRVGLYWVGLYYAEYIMRNSGLDEAQTGIKTAGRNINNLRYADDTTLMSESEELKSLLIKVKEGSEEAAFKLNIQKMKIMASRPITWWQIDEEPVETMTDFIFWGLQNHCWWWLQPWD